MSEKTIRAALVELIESAGGVNVHGEGVRIGSEADALEAFGYGADGDGRGKLRGWWIPPAETNSQRVTRRIDHVKHTYRILGYWTFEEGLEDTIRDTLAAIESALLARAAFSALAPTPAAIETTSEISPAALAGFRVWEAVISTTIEEYRTGV